MIPIFFSTQLTFRKWLEKNHRTKKELLVGFYKVASVKLSMTWSQSVDQALCFGWIDGVRRTIDTESYSIRFTPRKTTSIWSAVNIKKMEALTKAGLMTEAGKEAYSYRTANKSMIYTYEVEEVVLDTECDAMFRQNNTAWEFFSIQAPSYKKVIIHWIMRAKQEKTKLSRLNNAIAESQQGRRLK